MAAEIVTLSWTDTTRENDLGNGRGHGRKPVTRTHSAEFDLNDPADRDMLDHFTERLTEKGQTFTIA